MPATALGLFAVVMTASIPGAAWANSCNGTLKMHWSTPVGCAVGDTIRVRVTLGAGHIQGGTTLQIKAVRFLLDCNSGSPLDLNCVDEGPIVSYQGNITDTCATFDWTTTHPVDDTLPNDVVFVPTAPFDIPADTEDFCALEFDVRIEAHSIDGTPGVIEQVSGYSATDNDGVCNTEHPLQAHNSTAGGIRVGPQCDPITCNGDRSELTYPFAGNYAAVGDTVRVRISLGAGEIQGGSLLRINAVRFLLDCNSGSALDLNCLDEGPIVSYQGNITDTCAGVDWTTVHPVNEAWPNDVVFSPSPVIEIPADTDDFCFLEFDVRIDALSMDGTPAVIEEVAGYSATENDGVCNTVPPLQTSSASPGNQNLQLQGRSFLQRRGDLRSSDRLRRGNAVVRRRLDLCERRR